jgi:hypothetical protein
VNSKENVLGFRSVVSDREFEALLHRTSVYLKSTGRPQLLKVVRPVRTGLALLRKRPVR